jgi:uroporphyrinogen decarboxylase
MDYEDIQTMLSAEPKLGSARAAGAGRGDGLALRERFRRTFFYQETPVRPNFEFGYWDSTLEVWHEQGLPEEVTDEASAYDYFGIENWHMLNVSSNPLPRFQHEVIEETAEYETYRDELGCVARINKRGFRSIPHYIDYPVKDRATWEPYVDLMDPDDPKRWKEFARSLETARQTDAPIGIYGGSMAGFPRNLIGFERIATMAYEDPELLEEIINTFGASTVAVLERALPRVQVDFCMGWEDICFNMGPIIPPDYFRRVVGPWYRRIADVLVAHGCCVYTTDTDGNVWPLIDTFLDHGMNTLFPVEVHAGSDPCLIRDHYGKRLRLWGGVCKRKVAESREAIDAELERLRPYVEQGGFIPGMDHRVPADVPLANYLYYLDRKREVLSVGGEPKY